jgi:hypothetical protein
MASMVSGSGSAAIAASPDGVAEEGSGGAAYHTPLAGEPREVEFMGERVSIPAIDRAHMNAITVGGSLLAPRQGDTRGVPIVALYLRHFEKMYRGRAVVSILLNEVEVARKTGPLELVGQFRNYTLPVGQTEVVENDEVEATSVRWGTFVAGLGPGLRIPVSPYQVDNDFRLQLLGRGGYFYAERTRHSGPDVAVPPDTWLYGARVRVRYDGMRRNLLELPHKGLSMGMDLDYLHRDQWRMSAAGGNAEASNYLQASGHLVAVGGMPQLSERDRFIVNIYGGTTLRNRGDRFNAFQINGGPFSGEADDLARAHYGGVIYDDVRATDYLTASLGYRRELAFFLYLTAVGSWVWGDRATVQGESDVVFRKETGAAATVALDCAFFWNSALYLAYTWDSGWIRNGTSGSGIAITWNKLF